MSHYLCYASETLSPNCVSPLFNSGLETEAQNATSVRPHVVLQSTPQKQTHATPQPVTPPTHQDIMALLGRFIAMFEVRIQPP